MTTNISCRVTPAVGKQVEAAAGEMCAFRSEFVRRALRYYISENPDGLDALASSPTNEARPQRRSQSDTYDPLEEL